MNHRGILKACKRRQHAVPIIQVQRAVKVKIGIKLIYKFRSAQSSKIADSISINHNTVEHAINSADEIIEICCAGSVLLISFIAPQFIKRLIRSGAAS